MLGLSFYPEAWQWKTLDLGAVLWEALCSPTVDDISAVAVEMADDKAHPRSTACPSPPSEFEGDCSTLPAAPPWHTLVVRGASSLQPCASTGRDGH